MPRWLIVVLAALGLLIAAVASLLLLFGVGPEEGAELAAAGSLEELRSPMRPARSGGPRVLIFALDGVGHSAFRDAVRVGGMPRIGALLGESTGADTYAHAHAPPEVLSILPSTTYAAWTAVFTGEPVGLSGVSGNEWFDRTFATFVAPAPVSVHEYRDAVRVYSDRLLDRWIAVPTLFERADVRSYVTLAAQYRGADLLARPDLDLFGDLVATVAAGVAPDEEVDAETYGALDREAAESTRDAIEEHGLADLQVVYFPGIDLYTHGADSALAAQRRYLENVIDPAVGSVLDVYRARGALDSTYVLFVSDHGHTPTLADERHALGDGDEGEPPAALEAAGYRVRPFQLETDRDDFQAVFAYQGAFAYLYLADRSTCLGEGVRCDWRRPPRFEEDVLPALRALHRAARSGDGAPKLQGAVDLIFAREPRGLEPALPFRIWDGDHLVPVGEYLTAHPRPDLPELEARLEALGSGSRGHLAGDVLILARQRFQDPIEERYYFSGLYRSWHGSPSPQDSEILWVLARPASSGAELRERTVSAVGGRPSQLDFTPLVLWLLESR